MENNFDFVLLTRRCQYLQRMAGKFKFRSYNLAEHQFNTLNLFLWIIREEKLTITPDIVSAVLNHDVLEIFTNDIPWDNKNLSHKTRVLVSEFEEEICEHFCLQDFSHDGLKKLLPEELYDVMKFSDTLDLYLFIKEEIELGNSTVLDIKINCEKILHEIELRQPFLSKYKKDGTSN